MTELSKFRGEMDAVSLKNQEKHLSDKFLKKFKLMQKEIFSIIDINKNFDFENIFFYAFNKKNDNISLSGFHDFELGGTWCDGDDSHVNIDLRNFDMSKKRFINIYITPYINEDFQVSSTEFKFYINETIISRHEIKFDYQTIKKKTKITFDLGDLRGVSDITIGINSENVVSPKSLGRSIDARNLSVFFHSLLIDDGGFGWEYLNRDFQSKFFDKERHVEHDLNVHLPLQSYRLALAIQTLADLFQIPLFFSFGTLLGAVRHGGLIPWDDDMDACLPLEFVDEFENGFVPAIKSLGWVVNDTRSSPDGHWKGFQILYPDHFLGLFPSSYCDIFLIEKIGDTYRHVAGTPTKANFEDSKIFPLKKVSFGGVPINIPKDSTSILNILYGDDWKSVSKKYCHNYRIASTNIHGESIKTFKPAGPFLKLPISLN